MNRMDSLIPHLKLTLCLYQSMRKEDTKKIVYPFLYTWAMCGDSSDGGYSQPRTGIDCQCRLQRLVSFSANNKSGFKRNIHTAFHASLPERRIMHNRKLNGKFSENQQAQNIFLCATSRLVFLQSLQCYPWFYCVANNIKKRDIECEINLNRRILDCILK